jgi:hypothetical protein
MSRAGTVLAASERESFTHELEVRIAMPHQLVSRRWIVPAAEIASQSGYQAHRVSKLERRLKAFFLA